MEIQSGGAGDRLTSDIMSTFVFDSKYTIPPAIVDDVICRFLLNLPQKEKFDSVRVCFQIELAHWFFVDYYCRETSQYFSPSLQHLINIPYNQFAYIMFQNTPHLRPKLPDFEMYVAAFKEYKMRVPTYGAILMNQGLTEVVLVQGFRNNWGFPKGKVNEDEHPVACAIREVFEETGYDISELIIEDNFIESKAFDRNDRLYIIRGVDVDYPFHAKSPYEIKSIKWFNIEDLPEHKKDGNPLIANTGVAIRSLFTVYPYIKRLRAWISDKLEGRYKLKNFRARQDRDLMKHQMQIKKASKSQHLFLLPEVEVGLGFKNGKVKKGSTGKCKCGDCNPLKIALSSTIQDLLVDLADLQLANQQYDAATFAGNDSDSAANIAEVYQKEYKSTEKQVSNDNVFSTVATTKSCSSPTNDKANNFKKSRDELLTASSWTNFSYDQESIYRAFFTPSL